MFKELLQKVRFPTITGGGDAPSVRQLEKRQVFGNFSTRLETGSTAWTYQSDVEFPTNFQTPPMKDFMHEIR